MRITDEDGVRWVTFDRPDVKNAMTTDVARDLADAVDGVDVESHDAVVLTGEGDAFCAGGDVQWMAERDERTREGYERVLDTFGRIVEAALSSSVPIVARVNGDAVGAGLALAAVADFAYATADARFSCAFVRVGLIPDTGGTHLLPRLVGLRAAKRLAFTGEFVSADEAATLGLVNDAVPADELDETVEAILSTLAARPTRTIGLTKEAIHGNLARGWRDANEREAALQTQAMDTPEHDEGVAAFLEKRDPDYPS
ncbi:enoyl-CoA hydratase/isomerase family protein [Halocalculus aciditolerans]|uniref:Enoyl-CoA hydratase n=1 Tax=Halocalculus aciditolerans TaxID=1383812 RepID=A0A830FJ96_9EURY|nr:enoyl-CoA hydratase-related protein [Halocalculus aciditolerans]GGL58223.1 enoyl-CoA hydratase [Halocalculus aciditolerans]